MFIKWNLVKINLNASHIKIATNFFYKNKLITTLTGFDLEPSLKKKTNYFYSDYDQNYGE